MPRPAVHLSIPEPCHESWDAMTPADSGRHCAACQQVVVDFTQMSDAEVVAFLAQQPHVSCGRFGDDQLDRPLLGTLPPAPRWWRWLTAAATTFGLGSWLGHPAQAQTNWNLPGGLPRPTPTPDSAVAKDAPAAAAPPDSIRIYGTVHNRWGRPLNKARVRVRLNTTELTTYTNPLGYFTLTVPATQLPEEPRLSVMHLPHRSQSISLDHQQHHAYHFFLKRRRRIVMAGKFR